MTLLHSAVLLLTVLTGWVSITLVCSFLVLSLRDIGVPAEWLWVYIFATSLYHLLDMSGDWMKGRVFVE